MVPAVGTFWYKEFFYLQKLKPDLCFRIRLNSIIYFLWVFFIPFLSHSLGNIH